MMDPKDILSPRAIAINLGRYVSNIEYQSINRLGSARF